MFERYTEKARRAIFFARYEASQFGSPQIESEHLLLGLLRENRELARRLIGPHNSADSIRREIERVTAVRDKTSTSVDLPLSKECQRALVEAGEEADLLSHKFIGSEHVLLGILREAGSFAAQLVHNHGLTIEALREELAKQPPKEHHPAQISRGIPGDYTSRRLLYNSASETLVVEARSIVGPRRRRSQLFIRHKSEDEYSKIATPDEETSFESAVSCDGLPLLFFNSVSWNASSGEDWRGVFVLDLTTKQISNCATTESLLVPEGYSRVEILQVVACSSDGKKLFVNLGLEKEHGGGEYQLAALTLEDQKLERISVLREIRY
jgi:hypothetical protein